MIPLPVILITGVNGLIGWNLFRRARKTYSAVATYRKGHPCFDEVCFRRVDLDSEEEIRELLVEIQPDYIIHSRAICDLDVCEENPEMAHQINVEGTAKLVRAMQGLKRKPRVFVYLSTDHVFFGDRGQYTEHDRPDPKHVYGRTKRDAENIILALDSPVLMIRPGLVVGDSLQGNKGPRDFLFSRIRARKPIHYFTDEWRSPISAGDLAERIFRLIETGHKGIFHVAGDEIYSRYDLALKLALENGLPTDMIFPRLRSEDRWAHIRPEKLTLKSVR